MPNILESELRDEYANRHVDVSEDDEKALKRGVNKPGVGKNGELTGLATKMSHRWIRDSLETEKLTHKGEELKILLERRGLTLLNTSHPHRPYQRWTLLVTGRQLQKHRKSGGKTHEAQTVLNLPDGILQR